jgi:transcriptional regulator with XRE-family HTH domain
MTNGFVYKGALRWQTLASNLNKRAKAWGGRYARQNKHLEFPMGYISRIEHGEAEPSLDILQRLSKAYGIPLDVLMETAGYISKWAEPTQQKIPAFVFSAAEKMDERDWQAAQAFFQALLAIREQEREKESGNQK